MFPQRPDRAFIGYIDGGSVVLDISDLHRKTPEGPLSMNDIARVTLHTAEPLLRDDYEHNGRRGRHPALQIRRARDRIARAHLSRRACTARSRLRRR